MKGTVGVQGQGTVIRLQLTEPRDVGLDTVYTFLVQSEFVFLQLLVKFQN